MMCQCWVLNNCLLNDHPGHRGVTAKAITREERRRPKFLASCGFPSGPCDVGEPSSGPQL